MLESHLIRGGAGHDPDVTDERQVRLFEERRRRDERHARDLIGSAPPPRDDQRLRRYMPNLYRELYGDEEDATGRRLV
jgi:hypothetical protein